MSMTHPTVSAVTASLSAGSRLAREHYLAGVRTRAAGATSEPGATCVALVDVHSDPAASQLARDRIRAGGATTRYGGSVPAPCQTVAPDAGLLTDLGRDVVVMSTALALLTTPSTGAMVLGVCAASTLDVLLGAVLAGHVPVLLVPGKCAHTGDDAAATLLAEVLGMQLPPATGEPQPLVRAASRVLAAARPGPGHLPSGEMVDERVIVNAAVSLLAVGGPARHIAQLRAISRAVGLDLRGEHLDALAAVVPLPAAATGTSPLVRAGR